MQSKAGKTEGGLRDTIIVWKKRKRKKNILLGGCV